MIKSPSFRTFIAAAAVGAVLGIAIVLIDVLIPLVV